MATTWVPVTVGQGTMTSYLSEPSAPARGGIVMLPEMFGVNASMRTAADEFAAEGYAVLVPDLFWRIAPGIALTYSEIDREHAAALWQRSDPQLGVVDAMAAARWLRDERGLDYAYVGFGLGGQVAVLAAASDPPRALVSFYGVRLDECVAALRGLTCPLDLHVGDRDVHASPTARAAIRRAVGDRPNARFYEYTDVAHGFFSRLRHGVFDKEAASIAKTRSLRTLLTAFTTTSIN